MASSKAPSGKGGDTADTVFEERETGPPMDVVSPESAARRG
jgi:hypothetical protein